MMVAGQLSPAPLLAKPATSAIAKAPVDAAGWMRPDPKMDRFIAELMAKMTLDEKVGQLNLLTSDWESTGPTMRERSEEHTSELQSLMRISYAVFCLKKKNRSNKKTKKTQTLVNRTLRT